MACATAAVPGSVPGEVSVDMIVTVWSPAPAPAAMGVVSASDGAAAAMAPLAAAGRGTVPVQ